MHVEITRKMGFTECTRTHERKIDVIPLCTPSRRRRRGAYFLLAAAFFGLLAFFAAAGLLRGFLVALAAGFVDALAGAGAAEPVDGAALAVAAADFGAAFFTVVFGFGLDAVPAGFFLGDAAFFFGLLAFALALVLGFAAAFGLVVFALFVVPFLLVLAAADAGVAVAAAVEVTAGVATFLTAAFFVGDAERLRFVAPPADFALLGERAFFGLAPPAALLPAGVADRLRDFVADAFLGVVVFFLPADDAVFFTVSATLKLPLAPTPLTCFIFTSSL